MKKKTVKKRVVEKLVLFFSCCMLLVGCEKEAEDIQRDPTYLTQKFKDESFRAYLLNNYDTDGDGELSQEECDKITAVHVSGIKSVEGIELLKNLSSVNIFCPEDVTLDLSNNPLVDNLHYYGNPIQLHPKAQLNVLLAYCKEKMPSAFYDHFDNLTIFRCQQSFLEGYDVEKILPQLQTFCYEGEMNFDLSKATSLTHLEIMSPGENCVISNPSLQTVNIQTAPNIELKNCPKLDSIFIYNYDDFIHTLKIENCASLKKFDNLKHYIHKLEIRDCAALDSVRLHTRGCEIADFSNLPSVKDVSIENETIPVIDYSSMPSLRSLRLVGKLSRLDLSTNERLQNLYLENTQTDVLNLANLSQLEIIHIKDCGFESIDLSNCVRLDSALILAPKCNSLNIDGCRSLQYLDIAKNALTQLNTKDTRLKYLNCQFGSISELVINPELEELKCGVNKLTRLDLTRSNVQKLTVYGNDLTELKLNDNIRYINCSRCKLEEMFDISNCPTIDTLDLSSNQIQKFELKGYKSLKYINLDNNYNLGYINLEGCSSLEKFELNPHIESYNGFSSCKDINLSGCTSLEKAVLPAKIYHVDGCEKLESLKLYYSESQQLTIDKLPLLRELVVEHSSAYTVKILTTSLKTCKIKNCESMKTLDISACPSLTNLTCEKCDLLEELDLSYNSPKITARFLDNSNLKTIYLNTEQVKKNIWYNTDCTEVVFK